MPFRVVAGDQAGPAALGILAPPGRRTEAAVEVLQQALERWHGGGAGQVQPVPAGEGAGYLVRALVEGIPLLACLRQPGQPYRPQVFTSLEEAGQAADAIRGVLCPAGVEQELYFNHRHFAR
jgi:hypothetical protein